MADVHPKRDETIIDSESYILRDESGKYVYFAKAPPIKNIVFSGGGAKGVVYPGVIQALEEHKEANNVSMRQQIDVVAGSSIGALTAALFAGGMSADNFIKMTKEEDLKSMLGSPGKPILKSGEPLLNFIGDKLKESVTNVLNKKHILEIKNSDKYKKLDPEDKENIDKLLGEIKLNNAIVSPITFSMLRSLHRLDRENFKDLSVTSVCKQTGELFVFNAANTPDLDIATACRASASLPIILKSVSIPKKLVGRPGEGNLNFVDGGYLNNIPVSAVDAKQKKIRGSNEGEQGQNLQTLVMVFDETDKKLNKDGQSPFLNADPLEKRKLYTAGRIERFLRNTIPKVFGGIRTNKKNTEQKAQGLKIVNMEFTQRNIPLNVEGVKTSDFNTAKELANKFIDQGKEKTSKYLINHQNEAIYHSFNNLNALLLFIPIEKINLFEKNSKPTQDEKILAGKIEKFRQEVDRIINVSGTIPDILNSLAEQLNEFPDDKDRQFYYDYVIDQLRNKNELDKFFIWRVQLESQLPNDDVKQPLIKQIINASLKDQVLEWIKETEKKTDNSDNKELLMNAKKDAKELTTQSATPDHLIKILELVKENYRRDSFTESFTFRTDKRPKPCIEAEEKIKNIKKIVPNDAIPMEKEQLVTNSKKP